MTVLETERLCLRHLAGEDGAFILELLNGRAFLENIGDRGVRTIQDAITYIANGPAASYDQHGFGLYLVELKGAGIPIGICGLLRRDRLDFVEIGFAFLEKFWKQGYGRESAAAVLDYARNVLTLRGIKAITTPANENSIQLLERLGMSFENWIDVGGVGPRMVFCMQE